VLLGDPGRAYLARDRLIDSCVPVARELEDSEISEPASSVFAKHS
jgi:predicted nicotinamide N-methyase